MIIFRDGRQLIVCDACYRALRIVKVVGMLPKTAARNEGRSTWTTGRMVDSCGEPACNAKLEKTGPHRVPKVSPEDVWKREATRVREA